MPADISIPHAATHVEAASAPRRLPLGIGLVVAAAASVGLWAGIAAGVKALFF